MDRRSFLTLLASAPIAALAPLPAILSQRLCDDWYLDPNIVRHPVGCSAPGIAIRFVKQWDVYRDAPHVDYETVRRYENYVSLPLTAEEKRATEMVNAARARFLASKP